MERPRRAVLLLLLVLALAPAAALAQAGEPTLVRLNDAVGDTIDRAERDSSHLFPNTAGFQHAVILALPGPEFYAKVFLATPNTMREVFFRIMPGDLQRIRFLVNNRGYVSGQQRSDSTAAKTLTSFWQEIEEHPLQSMAGEPEVAQSILPVPTEVTTADEPPLQPVAGDDKYSYALHGATCGSVVGGCIGARTSYAVVEPGHYEEAMCGPIYIPPLYSVDMALLMATSIGVTAAGAAIGYVLGARADRRPVPARAAGESTRHRYDLVAASVLPAIAVGLLVGATAHGTLFGRENSYRLNNDPHGLSVIPAVLAGACVSVDIVALCYQVGRSLDRDEAEQVDRRNRALGH